MAEEMPPEWRNYFFLGLVLLVNTIFIKISFSWPWDSESFTLGVMGLIGLTMLYISWYRFTFKRRGLVPWMDLWKNPETSSKKLLLFSIFTLILSYFLGKNQLFFPDPTSLIFSLIALLTLIQATYVYLSVTILSDD
ncbi:MAG: hypothetical protein ACPHGU_03630 [Candidatus Thalassarchaeaceae archaeon]|jgi:hypothetical protein|nr:hypothetical protein [Euryarchaeota archaeon]|tara:strand:+ start:1100 stop:1510 length:411 start_codon:yes stop_codon:yes gene_type:complete